MKKILSTLLILLFMGASFTGCEQIKDLADQKVDVDFEEDLVITVPAEEQLKSFDNELATIPFDGMVLITPMQYPDIYDHAEEIEDWDINGVRLTVKSVGAPNVTVSDVIVKVYSDFFTEADATWTIDTWTLNVTEFKDLPNVNNNFTTLENLLDNFQPFVVSIEGNSNVGGFDITWTYLQSVKVTVNPL